MDGSALSFVVSGLSFALTLGAKPGSILAITLLAVSAILLDAGITANLVLGQRSIFSLPAHLRNRLNGLYIATIFIGGAIGSALGAWSFETGGWNLTIALGAVFPLLAFIYYVTEPKELYLYQPNE